MRPLEAEMKPKMPSIAARPLLISTLRPRSFCSGVCSGSRPNGLNKSNGTGCGTKPWALASLSEG